MIFAGLLGLLNYDINMSFSKKRNKELNFQIQVLRTTKQLQPVCSYLKLVHYDHDILFLYSNIFFLKSVDYSEGPRMLIYLFMVTGIKYYLLFSRKYTDALGNNC